ncbi:unnamed protein product, partial [Rotaria sordida]
QSSVIALRSVAKCAKEKGPIIEQDIADLVYSSEDGNTELNEDLKSVGENQSL